MNEKQKDNAAGYLYDLSKGVALLTVIKPLWTGELPALAIVLGVLAATGFFAWGSFIDGR
ncbi:hypothetical protein [Desulfovermiculus halophilus]|jgi:type III secretory pathway component EscT|uniref:hypothetical protein n=1 Tax=Desulfovermiculus halophilus TaxID=339722 RepID=UPI000483ED46|nr:hypothetical protein [Desulfovermiculus halophilus]